MKRARDAPQRDTKKTDDFVTIESAPLQNELMVLETQATRLVA